ncbi:DUF930 domain-containing protein [Microvirga rosea]|uniref:DUF930 domain-containing protein n=1 Tax=Microvirga rosea TaxID=2715425 RepID=UPI001D0A6602|nr:DUF930 domain-containing protein [Microvirga rosea]MCB8823258.1 DUF930 domain-containing protein [Microvirga rosea]
MDQRSALHEALLIRELSGINRHGHSRLLPGEPFQTVILILTPPRLEFSSTMTRVSTRVLFAAVAFTLSGSIAHAANARLSPSFMKIEPKTRSLQVCNNKGSKQISREKDYARLDRVVVDALSSPTFNENVISGTGGAFRLKGQWHQFQFQCILADDRLSATSFTYQIGDIVPEDQWEKYGLWR